MEETTLRKKLTGFHLKIIAIVTMFIDHIGAAVLEKILASQNAALISNFNTLVWADRILRSIGRLAFPIFCFLLVEGFIHTSNRKKYILRMGIFALASEIPFDMAFFNTPIYVKYQNVFFTLFIGLVAMQLMEYIQKRSDMLDAIGNVFIQGIERKLIILIGLIPAIIGIILANLIQCDYSGIGVLLILILYWFREKTLQQCVWGGLYTVFILAEMWAWPAFILLFLYNGERGQKINKYVFYAFYPMHLCVLIGIRYVIFTFM